MKHLIALLFSVACTNVAFLQPTFKSEPLNNYPGEMNFCEAIDYDKDGDMDMVAIDLGSWYGGEGLPAVVLIENTPFKNFPKRKIVRIDHIGDITGFSVGDFNQDQRIDFIVTLKRLNRSQNNGGVIILLQGQNEEFLVRKIVDKYSVNQSIVSDFDKNGYVDVLMYHYTENKDKNSQDSISNEIAMSWGSETGFKYEKLFSPDRQVNVLLEGDIEDDGDLDLIFFARNTFNILINKGGGGFQPKYEKNKKIDFSTDMNIQLMDVNKDQKKDIVFVMYNHTSQENKIYYLDGNMDYGLKHFPVDQDLRDDRHWSTINCTDLNKDGLIDLIYCTLGKICCFIQTPTSNFTLLLINDDFLEQKALVTDINNDGKNDIIGYGGKFSSMIWFENINFQFHPHHIGLLLHQLSLSKPIDFDNDGDKDFLITNRYVNRNVLFFQNDGKGHFQNWVVPSKIVSPEHLGILDVDEDKNNDVVTNLTKKGQLVWIANKGQFRTWPHHVIDSNLFELSSIQIGDLDKDNKEDILVSLRKNAQVVAYLNKGKGKFNKAMVVDSVYKPQQIELGDFNLDGQMDLIVVNKDSSCPLTLHLQPRKGKFGRQNLLTDMFVKDVNVLDWNKDKRMDIIVLGEIRTGNSYANFDYKSEIFVLLNRSNNFERVDLFRVKERLEALRTVDIDKDQDWDIAFISYLGKLEFALNKGNDKEFYFVEEKPFPMYRDGFRFGKIYAADLDEDNWEELYLGFYDAGWLIRSVFAKQ